MQIDYSITDPRERSELVQKIIDSTPPQQLTPKFLDFLANYIIFAMEKEQKKQRKILTDNRLITINKRETSYQGLAEKLESGEDGIYNMLSSIGKNTILSPKISITPSDIAEIPGMSELQQSIKKVAQQEKTAVGRRKYLLRKQLIQMRQQQYLLKNEPILSNAPKTAPQPYTLPLYDDITVEDGVLINRGAVSLFNPEHVSALLCNYSTLLPLCYNNSASDCYSLLQQLDHFISTLEPLYYDIVQLKIGGETNEAIQTYLQSKYNHTHSVQYISSLWRNKIPALLADAAYQEYLDWYYTERERGKWKRCSRCGCIKLANNRYFSRNKSSRDGLYSICKECRNAAARAKKEG